MSDIEFYKIFFTNFGVFIFFIGISSFALYFTSKKICLAGYLDPIHFYWTFTFGVTYGVVLSLYFYELISNKMFLFVFSFLLVFVVSLSYFFKFSYQRSQVFLKKILLPDNFYVENLVIKLAVFVSIFLFALLIYNVGLAVFAKTNRFEVSRGFGWAVRLGKALFYVLVPYFFLKIYLNYFGKKIVKYLLLAIFFIVLIFAVLVFGAKADFLLYLYLIVVAINLYNKDIFISNRIVVVLFISAFVMSILVLYLNLRSSGVVTNDTDFGSVVSILAKFFFGRIIANADQVYFSLPNDVIDKLHSDSIFIRLLTPFFSNTLMSKIVGYDTSIYDVGKQSILYYYPNLKIAGGPTSHFDLFAYKYVGLLGGWIVAIFSGFFISYIGKLSTFCNRRVFASSVVSALWMSSLVILLDPALGIAYCFDIVFVFLFLKILAIFLIKVKIRLEIS